MLLDRLFGWTKLRDEIVWVYQRSRPRGTRRGHDTLLFYGNRAAIQKDTKRGSPRLGSGASGTVSDDIPRLDRTQRLPLAGQKPIALLARIIDLECPSDGLVLDPFMGAGSTLLAAARLGRRWLGCDILKDAFAAALEQLRTVSDDGEMHSSDQDALELAPIVRIANARSVRAR